MKVFRGVAKGSRQFPGLLTIGGFEGRSFSFRVAASTGLPVFFVGQLDHHVGQMVNMMADMMADMKFRKIPIHSPVLTLKRPTWPT
jgi:hypothetical protein